MNKLISISIRYLILLALAFSNLYLFYLIFTPLTIYASYSLLNLFFTTTLSGNLLELAGSKITLIPACIAGSAYYLLTILNLSTPNIKFTKRILALSLSFMVFLLINILRIYILSLMHISKISFFDITHQLTWYLGSTIIVLLIWFSIIAIFKIKSIPFYTDIKYIYKKIKC